MQLRMYRNNFLKVGTLNILPTTNHAILNVKVFHKVFALCSVLAFIFSTKTKEKNTASYKPHLNEKNIESLVIDELLRLKT